MSTLHGYYLPGHESQYGATASAITRAAGCTWTAAAIGIDAATAGRLNPSPDRVHSLVKTAEQTQPATPGWSLPDAALAAARFKKSSGIDCGFTTGSGWTKLMAELDSGHYVLLQGDSDQFGNDTCSGAFNGDHCIGIHPATLATPHGQQHWIDDPICPLGRWEFDDVLREYATKLNPGIQWGFFTVPVRRTVLPAAAVWGSDVPGDIRRLGTPITSVVEWIKRTGVSADHYTGAINLGDLAAAMRKAGIPYGSVVNVGDVKALAAWRA